MKKFYSVVAGILMLSNISFSQVVDYLVPVGDLINMVPHGGDMCIDPGEYKQASLANTWGFQWISTNAGTPSSINIDWINVSDQGVLVPTSLNGFANTPYNSTGNITCAPAGELFSLDPTNYVPLGLNTVLLDYSAATTTLTQLYPFLGTYAHVEVTYGVSCTEPDVPTLTATSPICPGASSTINIAGNLNDATGWVVYTGSCGGTVDGASAGATYVASPGSTTTYYIRGEGGCTTAAGCGSVLITVDDPDAPIPDLGSLPAVFAECTSTPTAPTATDVCAGTITGTPDVTFPITSQGTTVVTWTYDDGNGNSDTQVQSIVLNDVTPPVPDVGSLTPILAECTATPSTPTATDNCTGAIVGIPDVTFPVTTQGTTVVTWSYNDGNGNIGTQIQTILLTDATDPVPDNLTLSDINAVCAATPTAPTATDNCAGGLTGTPDVTFPITSQGTTVVTWTYDDGNGNAVIQTQNVILNDATDPVPDNVTLSDVNAACTSTPSAPTATDNCAGNITGTPDVTFPITTQGTTVVTWTYDDGNGNTATQVQNVILNDVTDPVPDLGSLANINAECSATPTAPTGTDNCAGAITATPDVTFPITAQGTTVVTWTYDDGNGNTVIQTQNVILDDVTDPVITQCPGGGTFPADNAGCTSQIIWLSPMAADNCGAVTMTSSHNSGDTFPLGTTTVTYTATDAAGNSAICTFDITITSDLAAAVDLATDVDCFGNLTGAITVTTSGGTAAYSYDWNSGTYSTEDLTGLGAGTYNLTVTDANGCTANANSILTEPTVLDITVDLLTDPSACGAADGAVDVTVSGGTTAYGFDWNSGTFTTEDISGLTAGTYALTVTDANGCTAMANGTLSDPGAPTVSINTTNDVTCNGGSDGSIDIDVSGGTTPYTYDWDNDGTGDFDDTEDLTALTAGTYTVIVEDAGGCSSSINYTVTEPAAIDISVAQSGNDLTANATGVTYQWIDCATMGAITGETNATYTATFNGDFAVIVTDGPCSDTSVCLPIAGIGFDEIGNKELTVFPNPGSGLFNVRLDGYSGQLSLSVLDINGREVYANAGVIVQAGEILELDLRDLERGIYMVRLNVQDDVKTTLLIIE